MSEIDGHLKILESVNKKLEQIQSNSSGYDDIINKVSGSVKKNSDELSGMHDISEEINSSMKVNAGIINDNSDTLSKTNKHLSLSQKITDKIGSASDVWKKSMSGISKVADTIRNSMNGIFGIFLKGMGILSFAEAISDSASLHQNMTDLSYQMGNAGKNTKELEAGFYRVQKATGNATGEVYDMMEGLIKLRVGGKELEQLSIDALNLQKITGGNADSIQKMTGQLSLMGGLGQKSITGIMSSITDVQREFGMTSESVNALTGSISETTQTLKNMGKSAGEIEKFQKGTIKLAGAFESVGISAQTATDMINKMLDPSKIEDNALLFSKMGISMEDAMNGDLDGDQMLSGLRDIGQELQEMSGPQAAAMANAYGMSLQQLRQMGNMDMSELQGQFGDMIGGSEELAKKADEQATATRKMGEMWNNIKGSLGAIVSKFMPLFDYLATKLSNNVEGIGVFIEKIFDPANIGKFIGFAKKGFTIVKDIITGMNFSSIVDGAKTAFGTISSMIENIDPKILIMGLLAAVAGIGLLRKKFFSVGTDSADGMVSSFSKVSPEIGESLEFGIVGGLSMAAEKGAEAIKNKLMQAGRAVADDHRKRVVESHGYAAAEAAAEYQRVLAGGNTFGWAKAISSNTAEWFDTIKNGAQPVSLFGKSLDKINDQVKEKSKLNDESFVNEMNHADSRKKSVDLELAGLNERRDKLEAMGDSASNEQQSELKRITERSILLDEISTKEASNIIDLGAKRNASELKYLKLLSDEEIAQLSINATEEKDNKQVQIDKQQLKIDGIKKEAEYHKTNYDAFQSQEEKLLKTLNKRGSLTEAETVKLGQVQEALRTNKGLHEDITTTLESEESNMESLKTESAEINRNMENIDKAAKGIDLNKAGAEFSTLGKQISDGLGGVVTKFKLAGTEKLDKFNNSIDASKKAALAIGNAFKTKGLRAGVRLLVTGSAKAGGSLLKNITKAGLGLAKSGASAGYKMAKAVAGGIGRAGKKFADRMKSMKIPQGLATVGKAAGTALLTAALMKTASGQELAKNVQEKLGKIFSEFAPVINGVIDDLMPVVDNIINTITPIINKILNTVMPIINGLTKAIEPILKKAMSVIEPLLNSLMSVVTPLINVFMNKLQPMFENLWVVMKGAFDTIMKFLVPAIQQLIGGIVPLVTAIADVLVPLVDGFMKVLIPILEMVMKGINMFVGMIVETLMPIVTDLIDTLMPVITELMATLSPIIKSLMDSFGDTMKTLVDFLLPIMLKGIGALAGAIGSLQVGLGGMIKAIGKSFKIEALEKVGEGIQAVGNGLKDASAALTSSADRMTGAAIKLKDSVDKSVISDIHTRNSQVSTQDSNNMLRETLGLTTKKTTEISQTEFNQALTDSGKRDELITALSNNTKQLTAENVRVEAENEADKLLEELENFQEKNYNNKIDEITNMDVEGVASLIGFKDSQDLVNKLIGESFIRNKTTEEMAISSIDDDAMGILDKKDSRLLEYTEAMEKSGGSLTKEIALQFKDLFNETGGVFEDLLKDDGSIRNEGDWEKAQAYMETINKGITKEMDSFKTNMNEDDIGKFKDEYFQILSDAGNTEQLDVFKSLDEDGLLDSIIMKSKGDPELIKGAITEALSKEDGKLYQDELTKNVTSRIDNTKSQLLELQKNAKGDDVEKINKLLLKLKTKTEGKSGDELNNAFTQFLRDDESNIGLKSLADSFQKDIDEMNSAFTKGVKEPIDKLVDDDDSERTPGEIVTKMYPMIIKATGSGFFKAKDAEKVESGDPEDIAAANRERMADGIDIIAANVVTTTGLTAEGNRLQKENIDLTAENITLTKERDDAREALGLSKNLDK